MSTAIFENVTLEWRGVPYTISGDDSVMRAIAIIEDHVTMMELHQAQSRGHIPLGKLASAYAAVLRYAGCNVSAPEVYSGMWTDSTDADAVAEAIGGLLEMMIPPAALEEAEREEAEQEGTGAGKSEPAGKGKAGGKGKPKKQSGQRTKQPS